MKLEEKDDCESLKLEKLQLDFAPLAQEELQEIVES
jgi:hypothetical protein